MEALAMAGWTWDLGCDDSQHCGGHSKDPWLGCSIYRAAAITSLAHMLFIVTALGLWRGEGLETSPVGEFVDH